MPLFSTLIVIRTASDLFQRFYTIPIDKESQKICTTILPWGRYSQKCLPMGICQASHLFQSMMQEILGDLAYICIYTDDIQREGTSEADHLAKIKIILQRLKDAGFCENLRKSFFMQIEVQYLGYQLTSNEFECQLKNIESMQRIIAPHIYGTVKFSSVLDGLRNSLYNYWY